MIAAFITGCSLSSTAFAQAASVEAVVDDRRVVIACTVKGVRVLYAKDCPLGDARITDMIEARAGDHKILFYDGVLRRETVAGCSFVVGEKSTRRSYYAQVDNVVVDEISIENVAIKTQLKFALNFNAVKLRKVLQVRYGATPQQLLYVHASNLDEVIEYVNKTGGSMNSYDVAGFLKKNKDGRPYVEVLRGGIDTTMTDAAPVYDLLGFKYLGEELSVVLAGGPSSARDDQVRSLSGVTESYLQVGCP